MSKTEKDEKKVEPVTFHDACYRSRIITVGDDKLQVKDSQVTATTADQIDALRKDSALTEVK